MKTVECIHFFHSPGIHRLMYLELLMLSRVHIDALEVMGRSAAF